MALDQSPASKSDNDLNSFKEETTLFRSQSYTSLTAGSISACDYIQKPPPEASKEEYLQEINNRLMRELEEKNATLQQLQENYEHLLLKYAEAQNKIDHLRFQSSANTGETTGGNRKKKKAFTKKLPKPSVYSHSKIAECSDRKAERPSTLAVDPASRMFPKNGNAVTPTDSEGVSSVLTSMSGHSKILTNLDDKEEEKKTVLKTEVLEKTLPVFDKVTHWQNSLPPLDMIEKPDTSFFDAAETPSTRYNDLPPSDLENIPETPGWTQQPMSQMGMKKYLRTLSLPSSLTRRNILAQMYKNKMNHTIDISSPAHSERTSPVVGKPKAVRSSHSSPSEPGDGNLIIRRKKKPPFVRSISLPVYDLESPRAPTHVAVPPLDLENLTLTEDDVSPASKETIAKSSTFLTSHECSFQTLDSLNSLKATISDISLEPRCTSGHKSMSIAPNRIFFSRGAREFALNCCNVCGEAFTGKAASYNSLYRPDDGRERIGRCYSFNSDHVSPRACVMDQDSIEAFDLFTRKLKARSQITMKALTAHVQKDT